MLLKKQQRIKFRISLKKSKMKLGDRITGVVLLIVLCCLLLGAIAGALNTILYNTIGFDGLISAQDITQVSSDKYILKYTYTNEITQKSYIIEKSIDSEEYENIKGNETLKIKYVGYLPAAPHIEKIDSNNPLFLVILGVIIVAIGIRRNILFLKGKISAKEFT